MPIGIQVVGALHDDVGVLTATAWLEDLLGLDPVAPFGASGETNTAGRNDDVTGR